MRRNFSAVEKNIDSVKEHRHKAHVSQKGLALKIQSHSRATPFHKTVKQHKNKADVLQKRLVLKILSHS